MPCDPWALALGLPFYPPWSPPAEQATLPQAGAATITITTNRGHSILAVTKVSAILIPIQLIRKLKLREVETEIQVSQSWEAPKLDANQEQAGLVLSRKDPLSCQPRAVVRELTYWPDHQ